MELLKQNLGIDVDSKELKVNFQVLLSSLECKIKGSRTFKNTLKGFEAMKVWLEKKLDTKYAVHVTMEATGVYYENLCHYLEEKTSYKIHVVLPNTSNAYFKSLNLKSKTDKIDAKGLAQMGLERNLEEWKPISAQMRSLKKVSRERLQLIKEKTMVSNQLHSEMASFNPNKESVKRYKNRIEFLKKQIGLIERELKEIVEKDEELAEKIEHVCTIKGVAFKTAVGVVSEYNGFALFNNRNQVVSFAGYDVVKNESGTSIRGKTKISKKGNSFTRQMLYMPAMTAVRHDEHHKKYYDRIVSKTGVKMKGNVAIQRKLLLLIYVIFTKNVAYNVDYHKNTKNRIEGVNKNKNSELAKELKLAC